MAKIHLHASIGLGPELLLEGAQQGGVEGSGLRHIQLHDFGDRPLTVRLKLVIFQGITA